MTVGLRSLPQAFFLKKMKKKKSFADRLIQLANRGFGMSTDAFLKSVKKFLHKKVRIIPLTAARVPHHPDTGPAVRILGNIGALQKY